MFEEVRENSKIGKKKSNLNHEIIILKKNVGPKIKIRVGPERWAHTWPATW